MVLVKDKYGENEDEDSESTSESEDEDAKVILKHRFLPCHWPIVAFFTVVPG